MVSHFNSPVPNKKGDLFMKSALTVLLAVFFGSMAVKAQDYHAVEGSPYAGSMGAANNPASIVNTSYPWDLTMLSVDEMNTTNALKFTDFSYLSKDTIHYTWTSGYRKRYAAVSFNVHLFNLRLSLGRNQAIEAGANIRGYGDVRTGAINFNDTLKNMNEFFAINNQSGYQMSMVSSSWVEGFITYGRTLVDNGFGRLNGGATLRIMRGISGAFAELNGGSVNRNVPIGSTLTVYDLAAGSGRYAYSANYDYWKNDHGIVQNAEEFFGHTRPGAAIDVGAEYLVKPETVNVYGEGDSYYDYDWKIGVSLLDIGYNNYKYGSESRAVAGPRTDVTDSALNQKFDRIRNLAGFNDSMSTIVNGFSRIAGYYKIWNPARLVVNIDRPMPDHFAVNANLELNLGPAGYGKRLFTQEITLLAVTPRWEVKRFGAYLPVEVTDYGKVWVGGAFKAGPLLLGVDNWANVFSKSKMANGGVYMALVIRPGKGFSPKEDKRYSCPP